VIDIVGLEIALRRYVSAHNELWASLCDNEVNQDALLGIERVEHMLLLQVGRHVSEVVDVLRPRPPLAAVSSGRGSQGLTSGTAAQLAVSSALAAAEAAEQDQAHATKLLMHMAER
jgi:hypothetical protein